MAEPLLKAVDIDKSFVGVHALKKVNLTIMPGEIHCLAGENGCGKSTLIKVISGVYAPDSGHIEFEGNSYQKITPMQAIDAGIQVIYQDFSIFPNLTVKENLALNMELASKKKLVNWKEVETIAREAISKIDFKVDLEAKLGDLSVAEKQMVAICRALMFKAKLIIMDEPTTSLTKREVERLFKVILGLKQQGIATLFVSHKLNEVFEISEKYTILRSGELVSSGSTADLDNETFTYYMTGRRFEATHFVPENVSKDPIMEAKGLSLAGSYSDVDFSLHKGEILGITGLLDSGRTELALSLFGVEPATGGELLVNGNPVKFKTPRDAIRSKVGFVPEDRLSEGLFLPQSIADNIVISEIDKLRTRLKTMDFPKRQEEVNRWVKELSIATPNPENACLTLSGGNQQKIVLAKWLACDLDIMILNGPTVGVDIGSKHDIHAILRTLAAKGMGIIIISDDLPEIIENCSSLLIMKGGKIVKQMDMIKEKPDEKAILGYMM